jgi:hypothetical protein
LIMSVTDEALVLSFSAMLLVLTALFWERDKLKIALR